MHRWEVLSYFSYLLEDSFFSLVIVANIFCRKKEFQFCRGALIGKIKNVIHDDDHAVALTKFLVLLLSRADSSIKTQTFPTFLNENKNVKSYSI